MALVKTSTFAAGAKKPAGRKQTGAERTAVTTVSSPQRPPVTRHATATERVAAATEELASGLAEAAAAAEELRRAMEQISPRAPRKRRAHRRSNWPRSGI